MKFTNQFRLASVEVGEPILPLEDSRRFLTIDRQLLGLFQVFGNGVIEGWQISTSGSLSVSVGAGRGHINFMSAETREPRAVTGLAPNATNYIYAQAIEQTRFNRDIRAFSDTTLFNSSQMILLAAVRTSASGVVDIDSSVRNDISFIETIKDLINKHRHLGGPDNPSKIDLASEVAGQLPGFRVEGMDASGIVSGRLPAARIPPLDHGDLSNSGVLTHAQLDSFVRDLSNPNVRLLGELSAINLLQLYLAMKHIWHSVDEFATNQILVIPGITPDEQTDFAATTALVDRFNHAIQGIPALSGELLTSTFSSQQDFDAAIISVNIQTGNNDAGEGFFRLSRPLSEQIIDSFDNVFQDDAPLPGWKLETIASGNAKSSFASDSSAKVDGAFSAKLKLDQQVRVQATRIFESAVDWTGFNEIEASVETISVAHGKINMQILGGTKTALVVLDDFNLLDTNELTTGFKQVTRDISGISRSKVLGIRFYTDTGLGWDLSAASINIDRVRVNNTLFFEESGFLRFRLQTPQKSKWAAITWDADPNGGVVQARARSSSSFAALDQSTSVPFQPFFSTPGEAPGVDDNTNLELEVALTASPGKTASPLVRSVTVSFVTSSQSKGLTIDTADEFARSSRTENARVESPGQVVIDGRVAVGDFVYGLNRSMQQADRFGTPVRGFTGSNMPLSPIQAIRQDVGLLASSFDGVASAQRLPDRTYLIADALNDRILLLDRDGMVVRGVASNNVRNQDALFPLSAIYNRSEKKLFVAWSANVKFSTLDLSKLVIDSSGLSITLGVLDSLSMVQGKNAQLESGNVTSILLSDAHASELDAFIDGTSVRDPRLFLDVAPDAVGGGVNVDNSSFATLTGPRGLPIFVGDISFIKGLFHPISVSITSTGNWLAGNAKPLLTSQDGSDPLTGVGRDEITSVVEIVPSTGEAIFSDDSVDFSLLTLGGAVEFNERFVAMAGLSKDENPPSIGSSVTSTLASLGGGTVVRTETVTASPQGAAPASPLETMVTEKTDLDELQKFRGRVKIVERRSGRVVFDQPSSDGTFASDVQIDDNGNLVVVEKSFDGIVGRGRVVKMDEDGNVFFQFGLNEFASPNDARVLSTGNLVVST